MAMKKCRDAEEGVGKGYASDVNKVATREVSCANPAHRTAHRQSPATGVAVGDATRMATPGPTDRREETAETAGRVRKNGEAIQVRNLDLKSVL